jgi:enamine deaminase RidA (YjgF/YER057c/UK114 family)
MKYTTITLNDLSVCIRLSSFDMVNAGEYHAMIEGNNTLLSADMQYANMECALKCLAEKMLPANVTLVMKRYFVSDAVNHEVFLQNAENERIAVSVVQQPPLNGTKVSLWVYFAENARIVPNGENAVVMEHSGYRHLYDMQQHNHNPSEFTQTEDIIYHYSDKLIRQNCTLANNVIRTWIFVQGVDTHYAGMVEARKLYFQEQGLTEHTHYIASTGIEGKYIHPEITVLMDAYAISGICNGQISYLKGASHLNSTHEYGVTFERATAVDYGDRRHIFISGTASIDNKGQIVFPFDVARQTGRTLENIGVLLDEGGATMADIAQMIVYLRDTADYKIISSYIEDRYPAIPKVIVWAPVCRPGWLIEIECIAIKKATNKGYAEF